MSDGCDCCAAPTPAVVENRPGLTAIAYRRGTFGTFRKALTDELSRTKPLSDLKARVPDDYTITTIDLWSAVADVITFYHERIANEAFLRTATLRDSMLRLVRLVGYELRPGAAATAQLAFTLEPGAVAVIPQGTRVQSIPGEGETPQKFETLTAIRADARLNRLRIFSAPSSRTPTAPGSASAIAAPDAAALATLATLASGDTVMLYAPAAVEPLTVRDVRARDDMLVVSWAAPIQGTSFGKAFDATDPTCRAYKLGRSFRLFGFDAPPRVVVADRTDKNDATTTFLTEAKTDYTIHGDLSSIDELSLDARYTGLKEGSVVLVVGATRTADTTAITTVALRVSRVADEAVTRGATTPTIPLATEVSRSGMEAARTTEATVQYVVEALDLVDEIFGIVTDIPFSTQVPTSEVGVTQFAQAMTQPGFGSGGVVTLGLDKIPSQTTGGTVVPVMSGTVTRIKLAPIDAGPCLTALTANDVRDVVLYELLGAPLRFWPYAYPDRVASSDVFIPGRRVGWSSIEVGRSIEKGVAKPGTILDLKDLSPGRIVLLADGKGGTPVSATVAGVSLRGTDVVISPAADDPTGIFDLGLGPGQTTPVTAIASAPLAATISLPTARPELTVTIGTLPTQTITLPAAQNANLQSIAGALQAAIRAALPNAPTFAGAVARAFDGSLAVLPGVPGDAMRFGPSANDRLTVLALGLDPANARFLDGIVSAPIPPGAIQAAVKISRAIGTDPAKTLPVTADLAATIEQIATDIANDLEVRALVAGGSRRVVILPPLPKTEPRSFLQLSLNLSQAVALDGETAGLFGNVAPASHGETVRNEIVGDGDASQPFQRFPLKKKPVTYAPSATPGGVSSSLRVLVNGVKWNEVPTLYGRGPTDEVYRTRIADDATMTVEFGDGDSGARLPTGRQNIVATYRHGLGIAGRVGAGKLATLLDRPTGVKSASNLIAADGGADPETIARAREGAPGTVRTFGRAVSLRDFEDTALLAGEVAKATALIVWVGEHRVIHLTVAAQGGGTFSPEGRKRILATFATERDPNHKLIVDNYVPVAIVVDASIVVDDRHIAADVLAAARAALLDALSFERRRFAEPVYLSDVFRVLQNVAGVTSVDVNTLDFKNPDPDFRKEHFVDESLGPLQTRLLILPARFSGKTGKVLAAELATIDVPALDVALRSSGGLAS